LGSGTLADVQIGYDDTSRKFFRTLLGGAAEKKSCGGSRSKSRKFEDSTMGTALETLEKRSGSTATKRTNVGSNLMKTCQEMVPSLAKAAQPNKKKLQRFPEKIDEKFEGYSH
jgi:hypothetical protein